MEFVRNQAPEPLDRRKEMEVASFRIACGPFIGGSQRGRAELEKPGRALVPHGIPYAPRMFAARGFGGSMEPRISDGWWCMFHPDVVGTRNYRLVLAEDQNKSDEERYTLKKFLSRKVYFQDGTWSHDEILLLPLNPAHLVIRLEKGGRYEIRGWFVGTAAEIQRVEDFHHRDVIDE